VGVLDDGRGVLLEFEAGALRHLQLARGGRSGRR
jgi:hypothetical protein